MLIQNDTPFAAMGFGQLHRDGNPMAVICVRATFNLMPDGALVPSNSQEIVLSDVYEGDPHLDLVWRLDSPLTTDRMPWPRSC